MSMLDEPGAVLLPPARARFARWRWAAWALAAVVLVAVLALALAWPRLHGNARLAVAYGARIGCSCHFIGGRSIGDCRKDFEPGMGLVSLSVDEGARTVTAHVFPLARDSATWRPGQGCVPAGWGR